MTSPLTPPSPPRKKVLFIGHDASRTGAPLLLLHFLKWLRQNSTLEFEILLRNEGDLLEEFQAVAPTRLLVGKMIVRTKRNFAARTARKLNLAVPLSSQLRRLYPLNQFPVIYSNTVTNGELVCAFAKLGHRVICHAHEMRMAIERWGGSRATEAAANVHAFVAASEGVKQSLSDVLKVPAEKVRVHCPFGQPSTLSKAEREAARVRIRRQLGIGDSDIVSGMCGTTDWRKGADLFPLLAKAVAQLPSEKRHVFLWIGTIPGTLELRQIEHDVNFLRLGDTVKFVPMVTNPHEYLSALDLFALTSREDPFPMVMLEAASLGLPIVCFQSSGGGPELVKKGTGIAVPYLDIHAFAEVVVALGKDEPRRSALGAQAQRTAETEFIVETQAPKYLAVIEEVLGSTSTRLTR